MKVYNKFINDLYEYSNLNNCIEAAKSLEKKYFDSLNTIDNDLYCLLPEEDRDLFIRFMLKRFYNVDTAKPNEIQLIEAAFQSVKDLYANQTSEMLEIQFRNKQLLYPRKKNIYHEKTELANDLMKYYDIAHAFYLTEYELENFNPEDGGTILDCGAARGDTLLLFKSLYPDSFVYSFEMNSDNISDIRRVIEANNLEKTELINAFLYDKSDIVMIDKKTCSITDHNNENAQYLESVAIDDWVNNKAIANISLIKFDIEGGEQKALSGAKNTIKRYKPLLYIPIYHLETDVFMIPRFLKSLNMEMNFRLKWTEKRVWGVDCVLFVRFS